MTTGRASNGKIHRKENISKICFDFFMILFTCFLCVNLLYFITPSTRQTTDHLNKTNIANCQPVMCNINTKIIHTRNSHRLQATDSKKYLENKMNNSAPDAHSKTSMKTFTDQTQEDGLRQINRTSACTGDRYGQSIQHTHTQLKPRQQNK